MLALARVSAAAATATVTTATTASTAARTFARSSHVGTLPASVTACTYGTSKSFAQQRFFARSASTTATAAVAPPPTPPPPLSPSFASDVSAVPSLSTVVPSSPSPSPSPSPSLKVLGTAPRVSAEAEVIFSRAWTSLMRNLSAPEHESLVFPREIIWLNGAPGSGKTRNSRFMIETRGYGSKPIVLSDILAEDPACRSIIDRGDMVPDAVVLERLFAELLRPRNSRGALVDGFPRTSLQAECLTLLRDRMRALRATRIAQLEAAGEVCTTERIAYPEPRFLLCILYVGEEESIRRQLRRGNDARRHNARVREAGSGQLVPERPTDFDRALIAKRYAIFQRHRDTLLALRGHFPFSVIDAEGPLYEVQQQILRQFRYQSDEELDEDTFAEIRSIPLAAQIRHDARDALVSRLDEYGQLKKRLLTAAVALVNEKVVPACRANAFCGEAVVDVEENEITFAQLEGASDFVQMCVDVLSERGYVARHTRDVTFIPKKIDQNGNLLTKERVTHRFFVRFPRAHLSGTPHHHHHHHHTEHVSGVAAAEADIGRRA